MYQHLLAYIDGYSWLQLRVWNIVIPDDKVTAGVVAVAVVVWVVVCVRVCCVCVGGLLRGGGGGGGGNYSTYERSDVSKDR